MPTFSWMPIVCTTLVEKRCCFLVLPADDRDGRKLSTKWCCSRWSARQACQYRTKMLNAVQLSDEPQDATTHAMYTYRRWFCTQWAQQFEQYCRHIVQAHCAGTSGVGSYVLEVQQNGLNNAFTVGLRTIKGFVNYTHSVSGSKVLTRQSISPFRPSPCKRRALRWRQSFARSP